MRHYHRVTYCTNVYVFQLLSCPICGNVMRATEYSPPLFHQAPSLPAVIDGLWLSIRCESVDGGFWTRRAFRIYSGESARWPARWTARWTARWIYYADPACSMQLCTVTAIGTYRETSIDSNAFGYWNIRFNRNATKKPNSNLYLRILRMKRAARPISIFHLKGCLPRAVYSETPAILTLKARINVDWNGDYALLLTSWKDDVWEAPLRRCSTNQVPRNNFPVENYWDERFSSSASSSTSRPTLHFASDFSFRDNYVLFLTCWLHFLRLRIE